MNDIRIKFDKSRFGSLGSIKNVLSEGSDSPNQSPNNQKHVTFSDDGSNHSSLFTPESHYCRLRRSYSDTELSLLESKQRRRATTIGEAMPNSLTRKPTPFPGTQPQLLHIINTSYICETCGNLIDVYSETVLYFCNHCHHKHVKTLSCFIVK